MSAQPQLPPASNDPQSPRGDDDTCSNEEYKGWWVRGKEIYSYLRKMPRKVPEELGMANLHSTLLRQWKSKVQNPSVVGEEVPAETLGALLLWIRQSETLIYYVTYRAQGEAVPGPTTPGLLEVVEEPAGTAWKWPWIPGWEDPSKRNMILNPKDSKWSMKKKIFVFGGIGTAAFFVGKKFLSSTPSEY